METSHSDAFVFFGATGDLAFRQIFPSLQALIRDEGFNLPIIGVAKAGWTIDQFKARAKDSLEKNGGLQQQAFEKLLSLLRYIDGDYNDPDTFNALAKELGQAHRPLHYLAVPPSLFAVVAKGLASSGCAKDARLVIEKPFGHDLETAQQLNRTLHQYFPEENIFRIDHFLGKEPVQNILYTRFGNPIFEPLWNRNYVRSIQITMAESLGVEDRGKFYDENGTIRDVVQNHLFQVLANLAMEPPCGNAQDSGGELKEVLLKAVRALTPDCVVRGQFTGYRAVPGVAADSTVETFVAIKLFIDNWRWAGVPICIRAGKKMPVTCTEIFVEFKRPPRETFNEIVPATSAHLRMRINPDITIGLGLRVKVPGERMVGEDVELSLKEESTKDMPPYERLLGDAVRGNKELFARAEVVLAQWRIVDQILDDVTPIYMYEPGTWGPQEVDQLIGADGPWVNPQTPGSSPIG
jgi:glucose-6-phosphate 1-dehydrogenase